MYTSLSLNLPAFKYHSADRRSPRSANQEKTPKNSLHEYVHTCRKGARNRPRERREEKREKEEHVQTQGPRAPVRVGGKRYVRNFLVIWRWRETKRAICRDNLSSSSKKSRLIRLSRPLPCLYTYTRQKHRRIGTRIQISIHIYNFVYMYVYSAGAEQTHYACMYPRRYIYTYTHLYADICFL